MASLKRNQNPGNDGLIHRSSRMPNTIPGLSRFPCGVLLAQHRIEDVILEEIKKYPVVEIRRKVEPCSIEIDSTKGDDQDAYAVTVKVSRVTKDQPNGVVTYGMKALAQGSVDPPSAYMDQDQSYRETIQAKYIIGCDGAHSWTRKQLGFRMEGEQTEYVWGVLGA